MTKGFSILKFSEDKDSQVICETMSHYEAKNRFRREPISPGEQVVLRSHRDGETKVLNVRDNGYVS